MTLGCGKYRFDRHAFGSIVGIPRLLDLGQCNDAYSAIIIAGALAKAFDCGINALPLSLVVSWFEQKAVAELISDHEAQLFNYMRIARQPVGYLINFGRRGELQWKRFFLSDLHEETMNER